MAKRPREYFVFVGTYTRGQSEGIYSYRLNMRDGSLSLANKASGLSNPSFLDIHPKYTHLYAVNEVGDYRGRKSGAVSAFAIDARTGAMKFLNHQSTVGTGPCHISVEPSGSHVLVANYGGGSVAVLPILKSGRLGRASDFVQHEGSSINPNRQQGPHAHSIFLSPGTRHAYAPDLGLDKVLIYQFNRRQGKLLPARQPFARVQAGAGPRHMDFHPNGKFAYVINEIGNTITAFEFESRQGTLVELQSVPTLPAGFQGVSHTADIHVHPNGRFVYGSNRGHDSLVICAIDRRTGLLEVVDHQSTGGKNPRNFGIDPTGTYLLAAGQDTDNVVTFRIDKKTGKLDKVGEAQVPTPVCLKFVPVAS